MFTFLKRSIVSALVVMVVLIIVRQFVEARYLPSSSMQPSFKIGERLIVEKINGMFGKPFKRGEVVIFYPPPIEMGGEDLPSDPMSVLGRLTGLPIFPSSPAFIKRVIGLPGDRIKVVAGQGVYVNDQPLEENYVSEAPNYDLNVFGDISGRNIVGAVIHPYENPKLVDAPIVVPEGELFLLGDNRNNSEDSHCFGFVKHARIIGRVSYRIDPEFEEIKPPNYVLKQSEVRNGRNN